MRPNVLLALLLLVLAPAAAADGRVAVDGLVQLWRHGPTGEGVADVLVSNGRELVRTGADGRYRIEVAPGDTLFVVKPPGFSRVFDRDRQPRFWRQHFPSGSPPLRYGGIAPATIGPGDADFALEPMTRRPDVLRVLVFGDPQPKHAVDVGHFERDIVEPIMQASALHAVDPAHGLQRFYFAGLAADLGLTLGDVVDDDLSLLPLVRDATARLGVPWLYAPGNHDMDLDAPDDDSSLLTYRREFGPDTLAWETPQASFILLDDVIHQSGAKPAYVGGLREAQFDFLAAYLATLDPAKRLVIGTHIPLFDTKPGVETFRRADRERLFALLAPFRRPLLLSAHGHVQRHYLHRERDGWRGAEPLHEYNVGATCGGYWGGVPDAEGIPDATMADGTPNGFARLEIEADGSYRLAWQVAREPDHPGIALHAPQVLRRAAYPGVGLFANVFMALPDDRVEVRFGDGDWRPMQRVERADPRLLAINLADDAASGLRGYDRAPEAEPSTHLWRIALPTDLPVGEHRFEIRAFDRWRGELRASGSYRLEDAIP